MPEYIQKIRTDKGDCQIDYTALANLPSSLKNPNPITFTGAVSAQYDGSAPVTVNIPESYDSEELVDIRTGWDGTEYDTAGNAVREQIETIHDSKIDIYTSYYKKQINSNTSDTLSIPLADGITKFIRITNLGSEQYINFSVYGNINNAILVSDTSTYKKDEQKVFEIPQNANYVTEVRLTSVPSQGLLVEILGNINQSINNTIEDLNNKPVFIENRGYLGNSGIYEQSDEFKTVFVLNVKNGDKYMFSGGYTGWSPLWGYYKDGTSVSLLDPGNYYNEVITIQDENIVTVCGFGKATENVQLKNYEETAVYPGLILNNFSRSNYNSNTDEYSGDNNNIKFTVLASGGNVTLTNQKIQTNAGDYGFMRCKLKTNKKCAVILTCYSVATEQHSLYYLSEESQEQPVTIKFDNFINAGTLNFMFSISNFSEEVTIEISDFCATVNSFDCWYNEETKNSLKDYNTRDVVVSKNGDGHFSDIMTAISFLKCTYDVQNEPCSVFIKNGFYDTYYPMAYPYATIRKGANRISIYGESEDGVVIQTTNTDKIRCKILDIGGPCTIENLTIKCLDDGSYSGDSVAHNACYCIHNDSSFDSGDKYYTTVKNCKLYSQCHSPVGAGLQNNQKQRYINCEFISDGINSSGALYVHSSADASATNMAVEIDSCTCISKDKTYALSLPNVGGSLPYTEIDTTIRRSIFVSNGEKAIVDGFKSTHKLTNDSLLNNLDETNFSEL